MPEPTADTQLFGDLLALARLSWVRQMTARLARLGYDDYRRTDALVFRRLLRGSAPVGQLRKGLGVTRQAVRKVVEGLEQREYVTTGRDPLDARRLMVSLTPAGEVYARAVVDVIESLDRKLKGRTDPEHLAAARLVLRDVIADSPPEPG